MYITLFRKGLDSSVAYAIASGLGTQTEVQHASSNLRLHKALLDLG